MVARSNDVSVSSSPLTPSAPKISEVAASNAPNAQENISPPQLRAELRTSKVLDVVIIDRQSNETDYSYVLPGYFTSNANANANCFGVGNAVNCNGSARTTGVAV